MGGGRLPNTWNILQGGLSVDPLFWIGDLGDDTYYQADPQMVSPQVGPLPSRDESAVQHNG